MPPPTPRPAFSPRELEVLEHVAEGATNDTIARRLQLSPHTVDTYLRRIRAKTGTSSRAQLALLTATFSAGPPAADPSPHPVPPPAGRPQVQPPDPAGATTPTELVRQLRLLKAWSGEPSLRHLERRTGLPRSTLSQTLDTRRTTLPPLDRVTAIVRACGLPPTAAEHWKESWKRIRMHHCIPADNPPAVQAGAKARSADGS